MRILLATLLCAALAAPAAHADASYHYVGDCSYSGQSNGPNYDVVLMAVVAATDAAGAPAPTVPITVRCILRVNGVDAGSLTAAGTGAAAGVGPLSFVAGDDDDVDLCEHVVVGGDASFECRGSREMPFPPVWLPDFWLDSTLSMLWATVDPIVCPTVLAELHRRGVPGVNEQGDIYVDGEPFWDCPPYDIEWS